jgi:iron complex outermembrane receptor protein
MKITFLFILLSTLLFSTDILLDDLLTKYEKSESLYHKTKKESAGHLILFSRSDLDKMQAYTLNDVLRTLRMFSLEATRTGMTTLVKSGSSQAAPSPVKIFINSHELNSATLGNAMTQYGKMGLYFIDHIEVYQAGNSVTFGNEPGSMIIKLYTKEPSRENSTSAQISVDTRASLNLRALDARDLGEYSYLANVDISKNNYETYNTNNYDMHRDEKRGQIYVKFSKDESYDIEISASKEKFDSFSGLANAPVDGYINAKNFYLQATKHFNDELNIILSVSHEELDVLNKDAIGVPTADGTMPKQLDVNIGSRIYSAILEKRYVNGANDLFLGAHIKHQKFDINEYKRDGVSSSKIWGPQKQNIYMAYLENLYNINENNLITFSAKLDHYENDTSKSSTEHILRLGYVALLDDAWTFKLFAMKSYIYPTFRQTTFSPNININPDLVSIKNRLITAEIIYKNNNTTLTLNGGNSEAKDSIMFNQTLKKYINSDEINRFQRGFIRADHIFDINNKITLEYFKLFKETYVSPADGALIQLFNKIGKFDIYNELVYRSEYKSSDGFNMPAGYDYSLGVIYPINKQLEIKLKGENLLDKAHEVPINGVNVPVMERRGLLTMEYTF